MVEEHQGAGTQAPEKVNEGRAAGALEGGLHIQCKLEMEAKLREDQALKELKRVAYIWDRERREKAEASRLSTKDLSLKSEK